MEKSLHIYEDKKYKMEKTTYISLIVFSSYYQCLKSIRDDNFVKK